MTETPSSPPRPQGRARSVAEQFHEVYYESGVWRNTFWQGVETWKCPLDLWVYQEIMFERRPDVVVECGTAAGGSALFLASVCDLLGHGRVVSVDVEARAGRPAHPRIKYVLGSSVAPQVVGEVRAEVEGARRVMVILDSDHRREHVLGELAAYAGLVTPGDYLIVEDTNVNGHPVLHHFGPGPMEAVAEFLNGRDDFAADREREKFFLTFNPRGYLRRVR